ncbi:HAD family hydrolase [Bacillus fonticola]|uniref:HAD family hydrolase n=1 Tax=Bacillus fonticola TaxID=2728853 RepID=UPI0014729D65|nr:HAD family hydrolase [Bacillus fonticola]
MIKGVIFDFDGLLVDTESIWYEAYKEAMLDRYSVEIELAKYSGCIGTSDEGLYEYFCELTGQAVTYEEIEGLAAKKYREKMKTPVLREGVIEYLEEARKSGLRIGLASSSSRKWVEEYLTRLHTTEYFEVINTKDDVRKVKPDPELYVKTLEDLGLQPSEAIVFEDSLNGLAAAKRAGIYCVVVPNDVTRDLAFEGYGCRLESMKEKELGEVIENVTD